MSAINLNVNNLSTSGYFLKYVTNIANDTIWISNKLYTGFKFKVDSDTTSSIFYDKTNGIVAFLNFEGINWYKHEN